MSPSPPVWNHEKSTAASTCTGELIRTGETTISTAADLINSDHALWCYSPAEVEVPASARSIWVCELYLGFRLPWQISPQERPRLHLPLAIVIRLPCRVLAKAEGTANAHNGGQTSREWVRWAQCCLYR